LSPFFPNNALYHDVHHDPRGFRKNYSQPFFTFWDKLLGTYMDPAEIHNGRFSPAKGEAAGEAEGDAAATKKGSRREKKLA
jgi:sphinganine C4-monooxygenase